MDLGSEISARLQDGITAIDAALEVVGTSGGRPNVGALVRRLLEGSTFQPSRPWRDGGEQRSRGSDAKDRA